MNSPVYQVEGLRKVYNGRCVLDVPALEVHRGEILGLVGPTGAGKSTLLRLLNLLEAPTSGRLAFDGVWLGRPEAAPLALRRRMAMVFQRPVLITGSVSANVAYGLRIRGQRDAQHRAQAVLAQLGLSALAHADVRTLSGGEMQRVALARALAVEPEVLLLDEPTAHLDPAHVGLIEAVVRAAAQERGMTVVWVTHNIFQARRLATRVGLLVEGKLVEVAPAHEFFEAPRRPETRAFVSGEMVY